MNDKQENISIIFCTILFACSVGLNFYFFTTNPSLETIFLEDDQPVDTLVAVKMKGNLNVMLNGVKYKVIIAHGLNSSVNHVIKPTKQEENND